MNIISRQAPGASLPPNHSNGPGILTETWLLFSIATLLVALRSYGRIFLTKNWGWDDATIIGALVFLLIGAVLVSIEVSDGVGRHIFYLANPEQNALNILKYNTFFQMDNVICTLLTKISISLYILRIKNNRMLRTSLYILMILMTLATLAVIIVLSVSCIPLEKLWTPTIHGKCLPLKTVYTVAYVQSGFTIVIDLILTISPIVVLWNVRIEKSKKFRICLLMSLGLIATISNALRNDYQKGLTKKDMTYEMTGVTVLAVLELSSGVIAACIPACFPYMRFDKTQRSWFSSSERSWSRLLDRSRREKALPGYSETETAKGSISLGEVTRTDDIDVISERLSERRSERQLV